MRGQTGLEDAFIKVSFEEESTGLRAAKEGDSEVYTGWVDKASAKFAKPNLIGADLLRKLHPGHSIVMSLDRDLNILGYPGALSVPLKPDELITNAIFLPLARGAGGILLDAVEFGAFRTAWDKYEFTVYVVKYVEGLATYLQHYILHESSEIPARQLLVTAGAWSYQLHDEIWVFNQGYWSKNHSLWTDVQKANWDDVILNDTFKKALQKDVYSFFDSEDLYKELGIPWKRGLIMYGPPGNGKTISLKAIMKTVQAKGYNPLYVKSFQSWMGEEGAMQEVFGKARILAPCVLILEDLDSLINDRNRSFFLNQLDGIESNDGLLLFGTTNHFDRLDPGLSERPSRFDRKYNFGDPDRDERLLYAKYWQNKLINNDKVEFSDALAIEVSDITYGFSFAYLKEAFVSSLVLLVSGDSKMTFEQTLKSQIKALRKQLEKAPPSMGRNISRRGEIALGSYPPLPPKPDMWEATRASMVLAATSLARSGRNFVY
ncbi:P-loop containing nucleoside triphosphate hydrolase protein [Phellopilus nigrolimitatus]|nr:P-loop containing nucleoside triphosphate hydrolase protein [Phellopilus nigrolimitatus]